MTVAAPSSGLVRGDRRMGRVWLWRIFWFLVVLVFLIPMWGVYKLIWTGFGWQEPVPADNRSMPHVWDIAATLFRPVRRGTSEWLLVTLLEAALLGFGLTVLFVRSSLLERGPGGE